MEKLIFNFLIIIERLFLVFLPWKKPSYTFEVMHNLDKRDVLYNRMINISGICFIGFLSAVGFWLIFKN